MNRDEIEQKLWADQYHWGMVLSEERPIACEFADAAVAQFRQRYPVEPAADDATGSEASTKAVAALLDDIAGDSAFSGFGQSMQSRIYEAIEAMRKGQPAAPDAVWYDEPPFARDGRSHPCWIVELWYPILVAYFSDGGGWNWSYTGNSKRDFWHPLQGRRVSPIIKPPEPTA